MSHYQPRRTLTIEFDEPDEQGLFELHHRCLEALAARVGVTASRAAKLAINALHEVLLERGHYQSLSLTAQLDYAEQMHDAARQSAACYDFQLHKGRTWLTLHYDDGADQMSLFDLDSRRHYELARHLGVKQAMAAKAAIDALHRALVNNRAYISETLKAHITAEAAHVTQGPFRTTASLAWELGLPNWQPWER